MWATQNAPVTKTFSCLAKTLTGCDVVFRLVADKLGGLN